MQIARDLAALRAALPRLGPRALVPTMGALHAGHAALLDAARASGHAVVASVFVNPTQFASASDAQAYPRDETADLRLLAAHGCALAWLPTPEVMYPAGFATTITVGGPASGFEGAARPGHFAGVATVVAKLFMQIQPIAAYFGEKDWQQLQVVRRLAADLDLGVDIVGVPTVRDADGLALSSRNRLLSAADRATAPLFAEALDVTARSIGRGEPVGDALARLTGRLADQGFTPDYVAMVDGTTMTPEAVPGPRSRLIAAARLGAVRLLDNVPIGWIRSATARSQPGCSPRSATSRRARAP